jgi:hypothetical protein
MSRANIISIESAEAAEIAEGALSGAEAGSEFGLIGEAIGGTIGAIGGAFEGGIDVTFSSHRGSPRTYRYYGAAAAAIMSGDDPSDYAGERVG